MNRNLQLIRPQRTTLPLPSIASEVLALVREMEPVILFSALGLCVAIALCRVGNIGAVLLCN